MTARVAPVALRVAALFPYAYFHIGGDEWPHWPPAIQSRTNEAVTVAADASPSQKAYAASLGFSHTTDLYSRFVNFANAQARSNGKVTRMWSWDQHIQQFLAISILPADLREGKSGPHSRFTRVSNTLPQRGQVLTRSSGHGFAKAFREGWSLRGKVLKWW